MLGNEKNKEEIFTLFVIIIVLHNIHLLILLIPFEVPQSAVDIKIGNENDFSK